MPSAPLLSCGGHAGAANSAAHAGAISAAHAYADSATHTGANSATHTGANTGAADSAAHSCAHDGTDSNLAVLRVPGSLHRVLQRAGCRRRLSVLGQSPLQLLQVQWCLRVLPGLSMRSELPRIAVSPSIPGGHKDDGAASKVSIDLDASQRRRPSACGHALRCQVGWRGRAIWCDAPLGR